MAVTAFKQESQYDIDRWQPSSLNVGNVERWLSMLGGGILAAYALKRRDTTGGVAALAGAALLYRGGTGHCHLYEALGVSTAREPSYARGTGVVADRGSDTRQQLGGTRGIHVEESVTINKPIADVYRFWRNFENLPTFMQHLESVAMREEGISHWVAKGPAGVPVEWDARIINEVENSVIGWQSTSTIPSTARASASTCNTTRLLDGWVQLWRACSAKSRVRRCARTCVGSSS